MESKIVLLVQPYHNGLMAHNGMQWNATLMHKAATFDCLDSLVLLFFLQQKPLFFVVNFYLCINTFKLSLKKV